ncbi:UNVERIFIED_CONTAM: hypothetical protein Q9R71_13455 [Actinomycetes bacterium ARC8]|nr:hypothetical protein [Actinomycetes bacterium ARC8]
MTELLSRTLEELLNELQLPVGPEHEEASLESVRNTMVNANRSEFDLAILLEEAMENWENTGVPDACLKQTVIAALEPNQRDFGKIDGKAYFDIYERLRNGSGDAVGLTHTVARRLLSRTTLIAHLLDAEALSCSQVARLLHATEASLDVSYAAVRTIARPLGLVPTLDAQIAGEDLWKADQERSLLYFPDSNLIESCEVASREVKKMVPEANIDRALTSLSQALESNTEVRWPYLQILHWCTTSLEFYDHPASYLYEFSPRGQIALKLFDRYPAVTGNPVLNNAKAVERLNAIWARNRGGDDSHALVEVLTMLESLPFNARRQVARVLRAWLCRIIELETIVPRLIEIDDFEQAFLRVVEYITHSETNTQGVIEQRVVDAVGMLAFGGPGWRPKGIGDGINASNLSRHKLGDIEFANINERTAIALEAHGGYLSSTYVKGHQRSLSRIVKQRLAESWADLDEPENWSIEVIFVAHSREENDLPQREELHGVEITYSYMDYAELTELAFKGSDSTRRIEVFENLVVNAMNRRTVRQSARNKLLQIIESNEQTG